MHATSLSSWTSLAVVIGIYACILLLLVVAQVKVVTKAGYSGWWVLVAFVPVVGFIMMLVFAFSKWPVLQEVEAWRTQAIGRSEGSYRRKTVWDTAFAPQPVTLHAPGGWYPTADGRQRYWDGTMWTDHFA